MEVGDLEGPEFELMQEVINGFSAPEIARRWQLSERAVRARVRVVFAKLGVSNLRELREKQQAAGWRHDNARIRAFVGACPRSPRSCSRWAVSAPRIGDSPDPG